MAPTEGERILRGVNAHYTNKALQQLLPYPSCDTNKYHRGKLVVVAGSQAYPGAALLAARAAQRMGAGYTQLVAPAECVPMLQMAAPSVVVSSSEQWMEPSSVTATKPSAIVVGPGFNAEEERTASLLAACLQCTSVPVLVDGGALSAAAAPQMHELFAERARQGSTTVLTPHAGEAARLAAPFHMSAENLAELASALAQAYGAVLVLKGPDTFVSDGTRVACMSEGTPALAKAGTGDVLAGMVGALLAQQLAAFDACMLGAVLHARAGIAAAEEQTSIAVLPEDVIAGIPAAIRSFD